MIEARRILIIEDSLLMCNLLVGLLDGAGYGDIRAVAPSGGRYHPVLRAPAGGPPEDDGRSFARCAFPLPAA